MQLAVEVEIDGEVRPFEIGTDLSDPSDLARAVALVGSEPVIALARGDWDPQGARALLYINLLRAIDPEVDWAQPPILFADVDWDWGDLTPYIEPDTELEASLVEFSEDLI